MTSISEPKSVVGYGQGGQFAPPERFREPDSAFGVKHRAHAERRTLCYLRLAMEQLLRPIERRVLALKASGQTTAEIARRFKRGEDHIERIIGWTDIPRKPRDRRREGLRPVERRVLALRNDGLSHEEIGVRFRRDAEFARRVESIAQMRDDLGLLSDT